MMKSKPAFATMYGRTAPAPFRTSPFRSSRHEMTGPANGLRSAVEGGSAIWKRSTIHPSTDARKAGFELSKLEASPIYIDSRPPVASAIAARAVIAAERVVTF